MTVRAGGLRAPLGIGILALAGSLGAVALGEGATDNPLRIYGLALDETRLGDGFCERRTARFECQQSRHSLPRITDIDVETTPAPYVVLTLEPVPGGESEHLRIWYAPREQGGQSFMIATATQTDQKLDGARQNVLEAFGVPTVEFSHADMESRGIYVADLTIDTLLYLDPRLPDVAWTRIAHRLREEFDPTGDELFSLTNTRLQTLSRMLGPDFRGAIVQIAESGLGHRSVVTTILLDLERAQSVFRLGS